MTYEERCGLVGKVVTGADGFVAGFCIGYADHPTFIVERVDGTKYSIAADGTVSAADDDAITYWRERCDALESQLREAKLELLGVRSR